MLDDWLKDVDGGARQLFFFGYIWLYYVFPIFSPSIVAYIYHKTVSTLVTNGLVTRENLPRNRGEFIDGETSFFQHLGFGVLKGCHTSGLFDVRL